MAYKSPLLNKIAAKESTGKYKDFNYRKEEGKRLKNLYIDCEDSEAGISDEELIAVIDDADAWGFRLYFRSPMDDGSQTDYKHMGLAPNKAAEEQEYTSERTSVNQLPGVFRRVEWQPKTVNLDYGGGRFNQATDFLKGQDVANLVYDPYNRDKKHNAEVMHQLKYRKADTATIANVLNVIKEPQIRTKVLRQVKSLVKPGGSVYIMCYRGEGNCPGPTCNGWQENRSIKTYLDEVKSVYGDAELVGSMIVAKV